MTRRRHLADRGLPQTEPPCGCDPLDCPPNDEEPRDA